MLRVAVNRIKKVESGGVPQVIVLEGDTVIDIHPLRQEEPFTIWLGGTADVVGTGSERRAYIEGCALDEKNITLR